VKFVKIGSHHVNPDHIVSVSQDESGAVTAYLSDGRWVTAGRVELSPVLDAIINAKGGGQPV
jgi:hypothetical protein